MLLQYCLRAFLVVALMAIGMSYAEKGEFLSEYRVVFIIGAVVLSAVVIAVDLIIPRKSLQALSGVFFGLAVGLLIAYGVNLVIQLIFSSFAPNLYAIDGKEHPAIGITKVLVGIICCYFCVSFILQTKDDIRFVIPYVEFAKQLRGQRPIILDTSVIIDGRIADICETGVIDQKLIVPKFVLLELQAVADSADKLKRTRGRRGLDVLNRLQSNANVDVQVLDERLPGEQGESVDLKLLLLAERVHGRVATTDYNLNKVAKVRGVQIININDLANALKPVVLPGEALQVKIIKPGEEAGQGVGYLDDGTMVVVDQGRGFIGDSVDIAVTSVLQTSAGRMIFGRVEGAGTQRRRTAAPAQSDRT
ncbi:MAG: PIN/TRAM domain-containing protein [Planctomycetota bacterium]|nr:MAG: PIN/TRAM domain-containing protein [Planctomycetota bacterium]